MTRALPLLAVVLALAGCVSRRVPQEKSDLPPLPGLAMRGALPVDDGTNALADVPSWTHVLLRWDDTTEPYTIVRGESPALLTPWSTNQFPFALDTIDAGSRFYAVTDAGGRSLPVRITGQTTQAVIVLSWNQNPESNLVGYRIYCGTASRSYDRVEFVIYPRTNAVIDGLDRGVEYFFAATATNNAGLESDYSAEVAYTP